MVRCAIKWLRAKGQKTRFRFVNGKIVSCCCEQAAAAASSCPYAPHLPPAVGSKSGLSSSSTDDKTMIHGPPAYRHPICVTGTPPQRLAIVPALELAPSSAQCKALASKGLMIERALVASFLAKGHELSKELHTHSLKERLKKAKVTTITTTTTTSGIMKRPSSGPNGVIRRRTRSTGSLVGADLCSKKDKRKLLQTTTGERGRGRRLAGSKQLSRSGSSSSTGIIATENKCSAIINDF